MDIVIEAVLLPGPGSIDMTLMSVVWDAMLDISFGRSQRKTLSSINVNPDFESFTLIKMASCLSGLHSSGA